MLTQLVSDRDRGAGARSQESHGVSLVPGNQVAPPRHTRRSTSQIEYVLEVFYYRIWTPL